MYSRNNSYSAEEGVDFSSVFMRASNSDRAMADQVSAMQMLDDDIADPGTVEVRHDPALTENKNLSSIITHIRDDGAARLLHKKSSRVANREKQQRLQNVAAKQSRGHLQLGLSKPEQKLHRHPTPQSYESIHEDTPAVQRDEENITQPEQGRWQPFLLSLAIAVTAVMGFNLYLLNDQAIDMRATLESYQAQIDELGSTQKKSSDTLIDVSDMNKELDGLRQEVGELENSLASARDEMTAIRAAVTEEVNRATAAKNAPEPLAGGGWVVNLASFSSEQKARAGAAVFEESGIQADVIPTIVNGTMIYRLSVKDFSSRADAMQFVNKARLQYGFDGGWVWQSQADRAGM